MSTKYIELAIKKAIEGGYLEGYQWKPVYSTKSHDNIVFIGINHHNQIEMSWQSICLDPLFWQALGKAEGWEDYKDNCENCIGKYKNKQYDFDCPLKHCFCQDITWKYNQHRLIDHINEGKDVESFFKELLK